MDSLSSELRREINRRQDDELHEHFTQRKTPVAAPGENQYVYDRLPGPSHIRLVVIYPGTLDQEIECSMRTVAVEDVVTTYAALSYAWGSADPKIPVKCDGKNIFVTVNLYSALLRLRDERDRRGVWIDALCIDQSSEAGPLEERAHQVRMMRDIYSGAQGVVVDLGGIGRHTLQQLVQTFQLFGREDPDKFLQALKIAEGFAWMDPSHKFWPIFCDFMDRPWFKRCWVMQEFILARSSLFMIGKAIIASEEMLVVLKSISQHFLLVMSLGINERNLHIALPLQDRVTRTYGSMDHLRSLSNIRSSLNTTDTFNFLSCLDMSRYLEATDFRDHVYALLGLLETSKSLELTISYTQSEANLSLELGRALVREGNGDYCLSRARGINIDGPTWTPPLRVAMRSQGSILTPVIVQQDFLQKYFRAGGRNDPAISMSRTGSLLCIQGVQIDQIIDFSLPGFPEYASKTQVVPLKSWWLTHAENWARRSFKDWNPFTLEDIFWRTLMINVIYDPNHAANGFINDSVAGNHFVTCPSTENLSKIRHLTREFVAKQNKTTSVAPDQAIRVLTNILTRKICRTADYRMALIPGKSTHMNEIWISRVYQFRMFSAGWDTCMSWSDHVTYTA